MELISGLIGIILLFIFISIGINVGTIRKNIESIYALERSRAIRDGILTKSGKTESQASVKVDKKGRWICPKCGYINDVGRDDCYGCNFNRKSMIDAPATSGKAANHENPKA
jgi:hypothetical protein